MPLTKATTNVVNLDKDTLINGVTIGKGNGSANTTNTALGMGALAVNTTGYENTAVGRDAMLANTTGFTNTAVGAASLQANTTGSNSTAVGFASLQTNSTGGDNTAFGTRSLQNANASYNTAFGRSTLQYATSGIYNTAVGYTALRGNASGNSGSDNTAVGARALDSNTTGENNSCLGSSALATNTIGSNNTAVGKEALFDNTDGINNVAIGFAAGYNITGGDSNTAIGTVALGNTTSGNYNTALGRDALLNLVNFSNSTGIGFDAQVDGSNQIQLGSGTTTCYTNGAVQNRSDIRDKADVRDTVLGLEFVNELRPVDFKWDMREDYRPEAPKYVSKPVELEENASDEEKAKYAEELTAYNDYVVAKDKWLEDCKFVNLVHNGTHKRARYHHGLIAQEVKAVIEKTGIDFGGFQDHTIKGGGDVLSLGYTELIGPLIKAVQELSAKVAQLESK
jgi:hypothetical protein